MSNYPPFHGQSPVVQLGYQSVAMFLGVPLVLMLAMEPAAPFALAKDLQVPSEAKVAERARAVWENGDIKGALDILDQWIQDHPQALTVHKLRGDVLATSRRPREAIEAYETVLARKPTALDVRWAKWSVLVRWGQAQESLAELRRIAQVDAQNPLIQLRLAQELRKLDRLEESLEPYMKAVELVPGLLSWRLGLARARFDVLDYPGAYDEVERILQKVPPGSPLEVPAKNLLAEIYGPTSERGRRSKPAAIPEGAAARRKEWAFIRADAWRLFVAGRYKEAEPVYRKILALNPRDSTATHQLGLILIELGRCEEALTILQTMANLDPSDEEYADSVFRMGQCLVELKRWEEAFVHFQILYDAAVEFEERTKNVQLPSGTRVLSKEKLARWLEKVRPHVSGVEKPKGDDAADTESISPEELFAKMAAEPLRAQKPLDTRASLMGRDTDFSWFRFVIPASKVMRDDFPTGEHEFIPIDPGDTFPSTQQAILLVFGLLSSSYDAVPLTAQCFLETTEMTGEQHPVAEDRAVMSMSDQSGYFKLSPPKPGWAPGLYRCGLSVGERTSAYTHVDEVRFRIRESS